MKRFLAVLGIAVLCSFAVRAEDNAVTGPQTEAEWNGLRIQAQQMRMQARQLREAAQANYAATERGCWEKFLVSRCQEEARLAQRKDEQQAREIDIEAGRIERRIQVHERDERLRKRAAEMKEREAEMAARTEKIRLKEEQQLERIERKQAEVERRSAGKE